MPEQPVPAKQVPMSMANIQLAPGRVVQVAFPADLTDDELLRVMREATNLRVQAREELAARNRPQLVRAGAMPVARG